MAQRIRLASCSIRPRSVAARLGGRDEISRHPQAGFPEALAVIQDEPTSYVRVNGVQDCLAVTVLLQMSQSQIVNF